MPPLSLLFSSDQETSRPLLLALGDLGLEVELCPDIFTALERLTTGDFEVILADWKESAEAAFLLKTARESVQKKPPFTVLWAVPDLPNETPEVDANLLIKRSFSRETIKDEFLSSTEFRARCDSSLPRISEVASPAYLTGQSPVVTKRRAPAAQPKLHSADRSSGWKAETGPLNSPVGMGYSSGHYAKPKRRGDLLRWSARAAAVVMLGSAGYLASQTTHTGILHPVADIYYGAMGKIHSWVAGYDGDSDDSPSSATAHVPAHRVAKVSNSIPAPEAEVMAEVAVPGERSNPPQPIAAQAPIPASLRQPTIAPPAPPVLSSSLSPASPGASEPVTIAEDVSQSMLLEKVAPSYPAKALQSGLEGSVVLQAHISKDGNVHDVKLVRGPLPLVNAACAAVRQWRYKPYLLDGQAMEAQTYVTLNFKRP